MKLKFLCGTIFCMLTFAANAAIPYRTEHIDKPIQIPMSGNDDQALARLRRFYVGGMYDFTLWNDGEDLRGKNTSSFEVVAGVRPFDIFRVEANYIHNSAKWDKFESTSEIAMLNAFLDARIGNMYRPFYRQRMVPYVGLGIGAAWNKSDDVTIENEFTPVAAVMAGLGVELGEFFALDFGYRYMYMFTPKFEIAPNFSPAGHQFRVGARIHF